MVPPRGSDLPLATAAWHRDAAGSQLISNSIRKLSKPAVLTNEQAPVAETLSVARLNATSTPFVDSLAKPPTGRENVESPTVVPSYVTMLAFAADTSMAMPTNTVPPHPFLMFMLMFTSMSPEPK